LPAKQAGELDMPKDFTLEINPSHSLIINLNTLRKQDHLE
jgi:hypothetical protein